MFRYEHLQGHQGGLNLDGDSYATTLQCAWDRDRCSFGVLLPYDFLALQSFDAHIVGLVPFVQYRLPVSALSTVAFTATGQYAHTAITNPFADLNTYGGGVSLSVTRDAEFLVVRGALAYQYYVDLGLEVASVSPRPGSSPGATRRCSVCRILMRTRFFIGSLFRF